MNRTLAFLLRLTAIAVLAVLAAVVPTAAQPAETSGRPVAWKPAAPEDAKTQALNWLATKNVDPGARTKAEAIWSNLPVWASEDELLTRLAETFALGDQNAAGLLAICAQPRSQLMVPSQPWLAKGDAAPFVAKNLRLFYGRWLVHESLFDEAQEQLSGLVPADVVAPASLLFYQGVVFRALLNRESGLKSLDELLQGEQVSPRRYVAVARLMQEDLKGLEDDTLDHISRRMEDIRRRLDLGRAGPKVRDVEKGVIESLDKLIKKLEDQQQQQSAAGASGSNIRSSGPAQQSQIMRGKGQGDVEKKNIGSGSGWGDLPPQEREAAMQDVGRDLPAHYREVIEEYFRRLASEKDGK